VTVVVPDLLVPTGREKDAVARLLDAGETPSMAKQRGEALERWRTYVRTYEQPSRNLQLPFSEGPRYEGRPMLQQLEIQSFKAFGGGKGRSTPALETPPLTLLAGPNGAGKSTVLQALDILGMLVRGNIQQLLDAHGWEYKDLPHLLSSHQRISFTAVVLLGKTRVKWTLALGTRRRPGIAGERVERIEDDGTAVVLLDRVGRKVSLLREASGEKVDPPPITLTQSWLGTLEPKDKDDRENYPGLLKLRAWAQGILPFWALDPTLLRSPSRGDALVVGPKGGDLASFLFRLKRRDKDRFDAFVERVSRHYPRLVSIEPQGGKYGWKKLSITERWNGEEASFNAKQVSDGLLRLLAVASVPDWETVPTVVLLDEIENGLHPRMIAGVAGLLADISKTTQVVATTHSPITLNYVRAESTRLVTRGKSGTVVITPLTATRGFDRLREHFEPGELWYNAGEEALVPTVSRRSKAS
jgi:predicted ATPase